MTELEKVIANLGYPVGMGMAPSPADLARIKNAIVNEWIEQLRREIEGHLKAWDIEHAEVVRLRAQLWTDDEVEHEMALARTAIIEQCAKVADHYSEWDAVPSRPADIAAAIRAMKEKT